MTFYSKCCNAPARMGYFGVFMWQCSKCLLACVCGEKQTEEEFSKSNA